MDRQSEGIVAGELRTVSREVALRRGTLVEAMDAMAERNELPELHVLDSHLRGAYEQGIPLAQALATQAEALCEKKRLRILVVGGKASVKMLLPVAVFILPVLFVVLLYPAGVQLLRLGAPAFASVPEEYRTVPTVTSAAGPASPVPNGACGHR